MIYSLSDHWENFGRIKLSITRQVHFTLESLIEAAPDILVCSDPAGAPYEYTQQEVTDLKTYITHNVGTYATFFHQEDEKVWDNRVLAPLFGLDPATEFTKEESDKPFKYEIPVRPTGYYSRTFINYSRRSETVCCGQTFLSHIRVMGWMDESKSSIRCALEDSNVKVKAQTKDGQSVILNYVTDSFTSLYISSMPEYKSLEVGYDDAQFIYNAFLYLFLQKSEMSLVCQCIDTIIRKDVPCDLSILPEDVRERVIWAGEMSTRAIDKSNAEEAKKRRKTS